MREGRERQSRALDGSRLSAPMDWLKKALPKAEPPTPTAGAKAAPTAPPTPGAVSHKDVSSKELDELTTILKDSASLSALASAGLEAGTLEETASLELLSELSSRMLCRNRCRTAAAKFGASCVSSGTSAPDETIERAAACLLPSYFRHEATEGGGEDGTSNLWVAKVFLHSLPTAPEGTTLCVRFSLQETTGGGSDEPMHDVNLKVMQIAPHVQGSVPKLSISFSLADVSSSEAAEWTLDDAQRDKLSVLAALLGLSTTKWTPAGVLGLLLAGCGCAQLDAHACFASMLRASKGAHRDELLARAGSLF